MAAAQAIALWTAIEDWPELDDGYAVHAPIGTYAPNPFGLHEVAGNLCEWCLDGYERGHFGYDVSNKLDPVVPGPTGFGRVKRGGSYTQAAFNARSAHRSAASPTAEDYSLGVRPVRGMEP